MHTPSPADFTMDVNGEKHDLALEESKIQSESEAWITAFYVHSKESVNDLKFMSTKFTSTSVNFRD
jgi:hypothetical protein